MSIGAGTKDAVTDLHARYLRTHLLNIAREVSADDEGKALRGCAMSPRTAEDIDPVHTRGSHSNNDVHRVM